jgi:hypothetical protein
MSKRNKEDVLWALHSFEAENDDELGFNAGERIILLERDDLYGDGWFQVRLSCSPVLWVRRTKGENRRMMRGEGSADEEQRRRGTTVVGGSTGVLTSLRHALRQSTGLSSRFPTSIFIDLLLHRLSH